jgi:hypothetical protein
MVLPEAIDGDGQTAGRRREVDGARVLTPRAHLIPRQGLGVGESGRHVGRDRRRGELLTQIPRLPRRNHEHRRGRRHAEGRTDDRLHEGELVDVLLPVRDRGREAAVGRRILEPEIHLHFGRAGREVPTAGVRERPDPALLDDGRAVGVVALVVFEDRRRRERCRRGAVQVANVERAGLIHDDDAVHHRFLERSEREARNLEAGIRVREDADFVRVLLRVELPADAAAVGEVVGRLAVGGDRRGERELNPLEMLRRVGAIAAPTGEHLRLVRHRSVLRPRRDAERRDVEHGDFIGERNTDADDFVDARDVRRVLHLDGKKRSTRLSEEGARKQEKRSEPADEHDECLR